MGLELSLQLLTFNYTTLKSHTIPEIQNSALCINKQGKNIYCSLQQNTLSPRQKVCLFYWCCFAVCVLFFVCLGKRLLLQEKSKLHRIHGLSALAAHRGKAMNCESKCQVRKMILFCMFLFSLLYLWLQCTACCSSTESYDISLTSD